MIIRAVIFDMDGLMVDSEPLWHVAEVEVFRRVGIRLTNEDCLQTTGLRHDEVVRYWERERGPFVGKATADEVAEQLIETMVGLFKSDLRPMPGLRSALSFFVDELGLPLAVASSSPMVLITAALRGLGIEDFFAHVCSAEGETYGKPHPAVYLKAAALLEVDPTACLALEDSVNGVLAAKAARMQCWAVPEPAARGNRAFGIADTQLDSLNEIDAILWRRLLAPVPAARSLCRRSKITHSFTTAIVVFAAMAVMAATRRK